MFILKGLGRFFYGLLAITLMISACAPAASSPAVPTPTAATPSQSQPVSTPTASPAIAAPVPRATQVAATPTSTAPKRGGVLTFANTADPPTLDPHQMESNISYSIVYSHYSGLTRWDSSDTSVMVPDLAEKWEVSADGKTYVFSLRGDALWHDGQPLTAADVKFSLDRAKAPPKGVASRWASLFRNVAAVEAPDARTVRVTLQEPQAAFLTFVSQATLPIIPKHVIDASGQDVLQRRVVGSGPFKFKTYTRGVSYEAERFNDYFVKGRPYLAGYKEFIVPDATTAFAALRSGQLDMINIFPGVTPAQVEEISKSDLKNRIVVQKGPTEASWYFAMNLRRKPWDDVRVRRAVSLAWDRKTSIQAIEDGFGSVGAFMPPGGPWDLPEKELLSTPGYRSDKASDLAEAKKLLAEAGYPNGLATTVLTRQGTSYENASIFAVDQLAKIGIKATLNVQQSTAYLDARQRRDFDTDVQPLGFAMDDPDAVIGATYVTGASQNYVSFSDPEVDRLFAEQTKALDPAKRRALVLDMQRRLLANVPLVIQLWRGRALAHQKYVKGYQFSSSLYRNWNYDSVWLDR